MKLPEDLEKGQTLVMKQREHVECFCVSVECFSEGEIIIKALHQFCEKKRTHNNNKKKTHINASAQECEELFMCFKKSIAKYFN